MLDNNNNNNNKNNSTGLSLLDKHNKAWSKRHRNIRKPCCLAHTQRRKPGWEGRLTRELVETASLDQLAVLVKSRLPSLNQAR
jgi:hypothetical protein